MELLNWRPLARLRRRRTELGLHIYEASVHVGANGQWVALPARMQIDKDGAVRRNLATGNVEYGWVLQWRDKATGDKFSVAVVRLLLARYPDALDAGRSP